MNAPWRKSFRTFIRPLLPFPTRKTWRRWFPKFEEKNIKHLLVQNGIDTIIDVGANTGQFGTKMRSCDFRGRIISIEPVREYHQVLLKKAQKDTAWDVAPRMGLGAIRGEETIKVMGTLSSFKSPLEKIDFEIEERVPIFTLDEVVISFGIPDAARMGLKLDVQGFEKEVIDGAEATLKRVHALLIELSLKPVYSGELHYLDMLALLEDKGFHAVYFSPVVDRQKLGEMWQVDALLVRR